MTFTSHVDEVTRWDGFCQARPTWVLVLPDPARHRLRIRKNSKLIYLTVHLPLVGSNYDHEHVEKAAAARQMPLEIERRYVNDDRVHSMPSANVV